MNGSCAKRTVIFIQGIMENVSGTLIYAKERFISGLMTMHTARKVIIVESKMFL